MCKGPGCEDSYPEGRLSILDVSDPPAELDVRADARQSFDGGERLGADWSVASAPGLLLLGMPGGTPRPRVQALSTGALDRVARWSGAPGSEFGSGLYARVTSAATFDLWVGAPGFDYGRGAVELFRSAEQDSLERLADVTLVSGTPNDRFGEQIVECGDVTGDGIPEVAVTAPFFSQPADWPLVEAGPIPELAGAVFLLLSDAIVGLEGTHAPWEVAQVWWGSQESEGFGTAVVCDRDLDGDGSVDLVIGSPWRVDSSSGQVQPGSGQIQVVSGAALPPSGRLDGRAATLLGPVGEEELFGVSLATLGGERPQLAIGASGYAEGSGRVHVVWGDELDDGGTPEDQADLRAPSGRADLPDHFGRWLTVGDLDGDSLDDLIVGAPDYRGEGKDAFDTGRLWVWYGATRDRWGLGTPADEADATITGTEPFQRVGRAAATADLDDDGVDELLVPTREASPAAR